MPFWLPTPLGPVVSYGRTIELWSGGLNEPLWRREDLDRARGVFSDGRVFLCPTRESGSELRLLVLDAGSGESLASVATDQAEIKGVCSGTLLIAEGRKAQFGLTARSADRLEVMWRRDGHPGLWVVAAGDGRVLVPGRLGECLDCLDAKTGALRWTFRAAEKSGKEVDDDGNRIASGFPSVVALHDRVIVSTMNGAVYALSLETGEVVSSGRPPFLGVYVVTASSIVFAQPFGLSEFDHGSMREVHRSSYRDEVEALYEAVSYTHLTLPTNREV